MATLPSPLNSMSATPTLAAWNSWPVRIRSASGCPAWIPRDPARQERRRQARPRHREQRAQEADLRPFDQRRHAGQPVRPAGTGSAHRDGLDLVIGVVRDQEMENAALPARLSHQPVACVARRLLQAGLRLGAGPAQDEALDPVPLQQIRRRLRFPGRLVAQTMIDNQRKDPTAQPGDPLVRQQDE